MITNRLKGAFWLLGVAGWAVVVVADVWDPDDGTFSTANELVHGSDQMHELGPAGSSGTRDVDFFRIGQRPYSSYEVVVDATSNSIAGFAGDVQLDRYTDAVFTQMGQAVHEGIGSSRTLRWENASASNLGNAFVRVGSTAPCFGCSSSMAVYHIRAYETTYSIPRFNNSSSQFTVLLIQNTAAYTVAGNIYLWSGAGSLLGTSPFALSAKQLLGVNTATIASGASGSVTVSNNGRYGDLSGKAVALEPSTGFTFDTPMVPRPR
jgi:hypothetical protein